jgi:hypothetical protein
MGYSSFLRQTPPRFGWLGRHVSASLIHDDFVTVGTEGR